MIRENVPFTGASKKQISLKIQLIMQMKSKTSNTPGHYTSGAQRARSFLDGTTTNGLTISDTGR